MAGHSKFKNIQHRKGAQDKKRAKVFTKVIREITTSVKSGSNDPASNPRLRAALILARSNNLPKERVDKAMLSSSEHNDNYTEMRYEGFAPGGIGIIIEALTDNKNRTASEIRSIFSKFGGNLGETGSVSFMFDKLGIIQYKNESVDQNRLMELSLDYGAIDIRTDEANTTIYTEVEKFHEILDKISSEVGDPLNFEIVWLPKNKIMIDKQEKAEKLIKIIDLIEDLDDVQEVYSNYEFSQDLNDLFFDVDK